MCCLSLDNTAMRNGLQAAEPDALREDAAALVAELNRARVEDVLRIAGFATGASMERLEGAELLWVDRLGLYLLAAVRGQGAQARPWGLGSEVWGKKS